MGVQVVQHHSDLLRFRVSSIPQPAHLMGEVGHGATLGHCHVPPARQRLTGHEQVPGPVALVLVIKPLPPARLGRDGRPLLGHQLLGGLVETDYGPLGVIGFRIEVQRRQSPSPVSDVGGGHVDRMGQSLRVHRDVTLDSGYLLAGVVASPLFSALSVFFTLWESTMQKPVCSFRPLLRRAAPSDFLTPAPKWPLSPGRAANSIAGNNCSKCASRDRRQVLRACLPWACGVSSRLGLCCASKRTLLPAASHRLVV